MKQFLKRPTWSRLDKVAAMFSALIMALYMLNPYFGELEGRYFPVVSGFEVLSQEPRGRLQTVVSGRFSIDRPRCSFQRIEWVLVGSIREALLSITFEEGARVRDAGMQEFGPWVIDVPPEMIGQTRADVIHKCPGRPWLTRTHIYP